MSAIVAGPAASMILADLGADVIKVERPGTGEDARAMGPHRGSFGAYFAALNAAKRSASIDITKPVDRVRNADRCDIAADRCDMANESVQRASDVPEDRQGEALPHLEEVLRGAGLPRKKLRRSFNLESPGSREALSAELQQ